MAMCLPQQCGVVCAAHDEAGGGAAVAEGERRIARTEGCNIGEGEGGSAAFGGEDNGLDALRAEVGQIGKDAMQGCRLMGDINVENIADLVQLDQLDVLEDVGLSRVKDTQAGGDGAVVAAAAAVGDIAVLHRIADRAGAVLAAAVAFDRRPAAPLMAEGGQLLRLSDDTAADRAAALALALLGAGGLFGDDPLAEGVGLADGDGLGLGIVATDAVTVLGALLDTGSVPVDDPLAVLVAEGLDDFGPGIAADGTGEGPHAVGSAGGLLRDDACIPLVGALIHRDALGLGSAADDAGIGHDARLGAGRGLGHDARAVAVLAGGVERFGLRIAADLALVGDGAVLAAGSRCRGEDFPLMLAGGGDALGLGSVAADAITVFGAFLDTGSVPVNDPLAVLVAGGLNGLSPGIVADGTGEGAHAQLSAGGLLRDDTLVPGVLAGGGESVAERGAAVVHHADVIDVAVLAAGRLLMVADFPVVDRSDVAVLGLFCLTHLGRYAVGGVRSGMAVRVDTVVEEPRDAGGAALYELHEALLAVFRELDDFVQLLAVAALDSIVGVGGGCGDVQRGVGIADGDAAAADGRGVAGAGGGDGAAGYRDTAGVVVVAAADAGAGVIAGGCDGAATDGDIGVVAADARRTEVVAMLVAFGVDRAALDGHAAAAIKARADAGSGIAARCVDGAAVDHDVHLVGVIA